MSREPLGVSNYQELDRLLKPYSRKQNKSLKDPYGFFSGESTDANKVSVTWHTLLCEPLCGESSDHIGFPQTMVQ